MNPNLISRRSLADEVASSLQEKISKGVYKVNQKLPIEAELMQMYGVGRSTVREAVKLLVNSGFLRVQQGIGTFVSENAGFNQPLVKLMERGTAPGIAEVRQILEMKVAERAATNRSGNDISKLEHFLVKRNKAADKNEVTEAIEAHISFLLALADASKNEVLAGLYKQFVAKLKADWLETMTDTSFFKEKRDHYQNLLDGVLRQDARKAWHWSGKITGNMA